MLILMFCSFVIIIASSFASSFCSFKCPLWGFLVVFCLLMKLISLSAFWVLFCFNKFLILSLSQHGSPPQVTTKTMKPLIKSKSNSYTITRASELRRKREDRVKRKAHAAERNASSYLSEDEQLESWKLHLNKLGLQLRDIQADGWGTGCEPWTLLFTSLLGLLLLRDGIGQSVQFNLYTPNLLGAIPVGVPLKKCLAAIICRGSMAVFL